VTTAGTDRIGAVMTGQLPWVAAAGITFGEITAERAVAHLPDLPGARNHVGGPHAAQIFGLGGTASGAVGLAAFGAVMDRAIPLVARSEITYLRLAKGPLTAVAVPERPAAEMLAEFDAGTRPQFTVAVTITDADGRETTRMSVVWALRANR
jgi:acyl-coenzyme A thioesterase PaaI-like protein